MTARSFRPYEVGRLTVAPGSRPYMFEVMFGPEALYEVGLLGEVLSIFAKEGVPVIQLKVTAPGPGEPIRAIITVDLRGREGLVEKLASSIKRVRGVTMVNWSPPLFDGVVIDTWSHPLTFLSGRVFVISQLFLSGFLRQGWSELGTPFAALLYRIMFSGSRDLYQNFFAKVAEREEDRVKLFEEVFRMLGLGVINVERLTRSEARVRVYDSVECEVFRGAGGARGALVRGIIAGFVAALWGVDFEDVIVDEPMCLAKNDPYCLYVVKRR